MMSDLIRSEWIKFRSVRSTVILVLSAGALVVLVAVIAANHARGQSGVVHLGDLTAGVSVAAFLFGALGVQVIGQEYRFNTIRPTFTAAPWRGRVLAAKLIVTTVACAAVSLVMVGVCGLIGMAMLGDRFEIDSLDHRVVLGIVLFSIGWSAMGLGVGAIIRQPVAGMLVLLGEGFVAEQILAGLVKATQPWLPFLNGVQMTVRNPHGDGDGATDTIFRSVLGGGIYFFLVAVVLLAVGWALALRRDA
jgi:ABC-2 type transport system permease protein